MIMGSGMNMVSLGVPLSLKDLLNERCTKNISPITFCGEGTNTNPYVVANLQQLQKVGDNLSAIYVLGDTIDASATRTMTWTGSSTTSSCRGKDAAGGHILDANGPSTLLSRGISGSPVRTYTCNGFIPIGKQEIVTIGGGRVATDPSFLYNTSTFLMNTSTSSADNPSSSIFYNWNTSVWDFGNTEEYPILKNLPRDSDKQDVIMAGGFLRFGDNLSRVEEFYESTLFSNSIGDINRFDYGVFKTKCKQEN